jgi:hypothetical protein
VVENSASESNAPPAPPLPSNGITPTRAATYTASPQSIKKDQGSSAASPRSATKDPKREAARDRMRTGGFSLFSSMFTLYWCRFHCKRCSEFSRD